MNHKSLLLLFVLLISLGLQATEPVVTRENVPENLKWQLKDIYQDWNAWKADLAKAELIVDELADMEGTLGLSSSNLLRYFHLTDEYGKLGTTLYCYPYLMRSLDSRDPEVNNGFQTILAFFAESGQALSWSSSELVQIPEEKVMDWIKADKAFEPYRFSIENMYRLQEHVLPAEQEQLMSYFSRFSGTPSSVYTEVAVSDNVYPDFTRSDGEKVTLTYPMFTNIMTYSTDREEREKAYFAFYGNFKARENTMAAILNGVCLSDWAYAQAYKFDNTLQASLNAGNIPVSVYESLINTAKTNVEPLRRYIRLRKQVLGLSDYNSWDGSVSLGNFSGTYTFEEAASLIKEAMKPLGEEYNAELAKAFNGGWVDAFEGSGKETGAYSMSVYGVHPYILLNYDQTLDYVSTFAHELGHSMHSVFSSSNQPYSTASYTTFVAEVASNFNEELLLDYMLKSTTDHNERVALLNQAIVNLTGSFYRQSQFADFELQVHRLVEHGQPVNATVLNTIMGELNDSYNGSELATNELRNNSWAQIMHFYDRPYYVYQYATSYAAAVQIHKMITTGSDMERKEALERYLTLLKSGGNNYPVEQLKAAGVDMTSPEPILAVVQRLDQLVGQLEDELKAAGRL
ncbi:MAG: oligoendopeptidase F [Bacteroidota bacterium]